MREITSFDDFMAESGGTVRKPYNELRAGDVVVIDGEEKELSWAGTGASQHGVRADRHGTVYSMRFADGSIKKFVLGVHSLTFDVVQ